MEREFKVYEIVCDNGMKYIGCTSQTIKERWRQHVGRAIRDNHRAPLYALIREKGKDAFKINVLAIEGNLQEAQEIEIKTISGLPSHVKLNQSEGGYLDAKAGGKVFWKELNKNPEARKAYLEKLSEIKKANDWTDYDALQEKAQRWRKENPKAAYKAAKRGLRLAMQAKEDKTPPKTEDTRSRKEQLKWKYDRGAALKESVTKIWANRTEEAKKAIGAKIAIKTKERMAKTAILPDFNQNEYPFTKPHVLRLLKKGLSKEEIVARAVETVKNKGAHWKMIKNRLDIMGVQVEDL